MQRQFWRGGGCNTGVDSHTHTYSSKWTYDDDFHWHAATCEHKSEKADKKEHTVVNGKCTVCDYEDGSVPKNYKSVTFNLNGGNGKIDGMQFEVGQVMKDLPSPTRNGYTFICWEEALGGEYTAASVMPDRNLTLVAKWEKILTKYSDKFVSLKPATEGCKNSSLQMEYYGEVDKFVYVEITSDDLGGVDKVGQNNNFNLRSMAGMEYKVQAGYTWAWYQGSFDVPNGAQRFTLGYGSNIQFVTITDGDGVVQQTYLIDLYVMHDYYVSLYNNVYETEPYERVRVIENERFPESHEAAKSVFEADKRVYKNAETGNFEEFVYSTAITKNWSLYQTYKEYTVTADSGITAELDGGTLEEALKFTPYTVGYTLPVPVKEGYDFIGWQNSYNEFVTDSQGNGGVKYIAETSNAVHDTDVRVSKKLTAVFLVKNMYYDSGIDSISSFKAVRGIEYTDIYQTKVSKYTFTAEAGHTVKEGTQRAEIGAEITADAGKAGHNFVGWYDGETKLSEAADYKFAMPAENINYTAKYEVFDELKNFELTATKTTVTVTGIKDKTVTEIVVPSIVTSIGEGAFGGCSALESLTLPFVGSDVNATKSSVSTLFGYVFGIESYDGATATNQYYGTGSKDYVTNYIPDSLTSLTVTGGKLYYKAISNCATLTSITLLDDVTIGDASRVGHGALSGCSSLTEVRLPDNLTAIPQNMFSSCSSLVSISIPETVTDIGCQTFMDCSSLTDVNIPDGVTEIEGDVFAGCSSLTNITIPDGVTRIQDYAFSDCKNLSSIVIPANVKRIDNRAFSGCSNLFVVYNLSSLNFVKGSWDNGYVAYYALAIYDSLDEEAPFVTTDDGFTFFDGDETVLIKYEGDAVNLELPEFGGKNYSINSGAFSNYSQAKSVVIPDCVTSIPQGMLSHCNDIESITLPFVGANATATSASATTLFGYIFGSGDTAQFYWRSSSTVYYKIPSTLKSVTVTGGKLLYGAFSNCANIESVTITGSITSIGARVFYQCTSLSNVNLSDNVTYIGERSFFGCSSLTSITIPENIATLGEAAFQSCKYLTEINYNAIQCGHDYLITRSKNDIFADAGINGEGITVRIGANVKSIPQYLFCPHYEVSVQYRPKIVNVIFEKNSQCTSIEKYAFYSCLALEAFYYSGTQEQLTAISGEVALPSSEKRYYYSETRPEESGNYWHFDTDGKTPVIWDV